MSIHQLPVKFILFILSVGFCSCHKKLQKKENRTVEISDFEDTITLFPKYLTKAYVLGKFDYTEHPGFIKIPKELSSKKMYLRKDVFEMFQKMANAAKKDGITLKIISATRNFSHQKRIWDYKWNEKYKKYSPLKRVKKILEYTSMPSTSRHHWGTDIDINNLECAYFLKGKGKDEYTWLCNHAHTFGFYQVYTSKKNGRTGYNEEKWHWSYVPLSHLYLQYYNQYVTYQDITGFQGAVFAIQIDMITNYVNGVSLEVLKYKP